MLYRDGNVKQDVNTIVFRFGFDVLFWERKLYYGIFYTYIYIYIFFFLHLTNLGILCIFPIGKIIKYF